MRETLEILVCQCENQEKSLVQEAKKAKFLSAFTSDYIMFSIIDHLN